MLGGLKKLKNQIGESRAPVVLLAVAGGLLTVPGVTTFWAGLVFPVEPGLISSLFLIF